MLLPLSCQIYVSIPLLFKCNSPKVLLKQTSSHFGLVVSVLVGVLFSDLCVVGVPLSNPCVVRVLLSLSDPCVVDSFFFARVLKQPICDSIVLL